MNLKRFKVAFAAILMVGTVFTACSGEDGEDGAVGPAGNANVQSSNYSVLTTDWTTTNSSLTDTIDVPSITSSIVQTGNVQVFQTRDSVVTAATEWTALPYTSGVLSYSFAYSTGRLVLNFTATIQGARPTTAGLGGNHIYKVIVIPSSSKVDGVDLNNFEEVKAVYGIKEFDLD